ncbi:MAG: PEP-CTERM sorting domain-containing protein [Thiobacillus sp.]|nr:PEP-CTERM sorting domain-containing protein [Thiobacillus sp.]
MIAIRTVGVAAFLASSALLSGQAAAVPVTVAGATVSFTFDSALAGLFGAPTVSGDSLFFTPVNFKAFSSNNGFVQAGQTFNVAVTANTGYQIASAGLAESGDYYNINTSGLEGVAVAGQLRLTDLEAPFTPAVTSAISTPAPLTATTTFPVGFSTTNWTASAHAAVPLGWGGVDAIPTAVNVTIENLLLASSLNAASAAFIEKKFAGLEIVTTPVPEADNYALFLAGLGIIGYLARRRHLRT